MIIILTKKSKKIFLENRGPLFLYQKFLEKKIENRGALKMKSKNFWKKIFENRDPYI